MPWLATYLVRKRPDVTVDNGEQVHLPPGAVVDTSVAEGGLDGFLGHMDSFTFTLTQATLIGGVRLATTSGSFDVLEVGDEEEPAEADLQITCYRVFTNNVEAESKLSASPPIDISGGSWSGQTAQALDSPVLLTPGNYRVDLSIGLSESYEFDPALPDVNIILVGINFSEFYGTAPNGTKFIGLEAYTDYDIGIEVVILRDELNELIAADADDAEIAAKQAELDAAEAGTFGGSGRTTYYFPGSDDPPLAIDLQTYRMAPVDWSAYLLARAIGNVPDAYRRTWLTDHEYIEDRWQDEIEELPGFGVWGFTDPDIQGDAAGGGALVEQQTVKQAIGRILFESAAAFDWTGPLARIIIIPRTKPDYQKLITLDDIERASIDDPTPQLNISYTDTTEIVNVIEARFTRDYSQSRAIESYEHPLALYRNSTSVSAIGKQTNPDMFWFDWQHSSTTMNEVVGAWHKHLYEPKKIVEFIGFLNVLELQRGDIISFDLTPSITIGTSPGSPDENQGYGDGGYGDAGYGGSVITPPYTLIGEKFDQLTTETRFMIEQVFVNWATKRVQVKAREVP